MNNKKKRIKIDTPLGSIYLTFKESKIPDVMCCEECSYKNLCDKIIDPRYPDNPDYKFIDLCGDIEKIDANLAEDESSELLSNLIPEEGTLEENLSIFEDIFHSIIKKDPLIKLSRVIDSICSNWCEYYNKEHTNCNCNNNLCIMHNLFKNNKLDSDPNSN